jgi:hypothetical protein
VAAAFAAGPLATEVLGPELGTASALKMAYASVTKGTTALLVAALAAAEGHGVRAALARQWDLDEPGADDARGERARRVTRKAWRFAGEMEEIAATFEAAGVPGGFHAAAAELYRRLAGLGGAAELPALTQVLAAAAAAALRPRAATRFPLATRLPLAASRRTSDERQRDPARPPLPGRGRLLAPAGFPAARLPPGGSARAQLARRAPRLRALALLPQRRRVGLDEVAWLWEAEGEVVGLVMPDGGRGEAHLSVDPGLRTPELEGSMLDVAEAELSEATPEGARRLVVWAMEDDPLRPPLLAERGYERREWVDHKWRGDLTRPLPEPEVAPGYAVRALGDGLELLERCYASGLGFHEGDTAVALDNRADPSWYRNIQNAPLYRRDLDLVAVAPDGAIGAFCTLWFDDVTRSVYVEPVATVPRTAGTVWPERCCSRACGGHSAWARPWRRSAASARPPTGSTAR